MEFSFTNRPSVDQIVSVLRGNHAQLRINIGVSEIMILKALFQSKRTVMKEVECSKYEYTFLYWVEFLEFIPRLAFQKYQETYQHSSWPLLRKTKVLMEGLLKLVQKPCLDPP